MTPAQEPLSAFIAALEDRGASPLERVRRGNAALAAVREPMRTQVAQAPPRRVSVALGLALETVPHFAAVLPDPVRLGSVDPGEPVRRAPPPPFVVGYDLLEEALGIPAWELEELREEIDRRAGLLLKQSRVATWLSTHFGLPDRAGAASLAQQLFGRLHDPSMDLVRRGSQLYVLADLPSYVPGGALWVSWLAPRSSLAPTSFRGRAVDRGLRARLGRALGLDAEEVVDLLDGMVTILPRDDAARLLHLDQWRASGRAVLTDLAPGYTETEWLTEPVPDEGAQHEGWLVRDPRGAPALRGNLAQVFDTLALTRVSALLRVLYGLLLAQVDRAGPEGAELPLTAADLDVFDVPRHLRAVLTPLLEWADRSTTRDTLAAHLRVPPAAVAEQLAKVRTIWGHQAQTAWLGGEGRPAPSVQSLVLRHLLATYGGLRAALAAQPDPRADHTEVLLMFAGHYLAEGRLERLWIASQSDVAQPQDRLAPTEDIVGHWFWPAFSRVLAAREGTGS